MSCKYNTQGEFTCSLDNSNLDNFNVINNKAVYGYNNYKSTTDNLNSCSVLCNNDNNCAAFYINSYSKSCNLVNNVNGTEEEANSTLYLKK